MEMCRAYAPRSSNVGVALRRHGRLSGEDTPWLRRPDWSRTSASASGRGRTVPASSMRRESVVFGTNLYNKSGTIDRILGNYCAYLPGYAEKCARDMLSGVAKTDLFVAEIIARTAMGMS